jgi:hypothetical protein
MKKTEGIPGGAERVFSAQRRCAITTSVAVGYQERDKEKIKRKFPWHYNAVY